MDKYKAKLEAVLTTDAERINMTLDGTANDLANMAVAALAQIMVDSSENWDELMKHVPDVDLALAAFLGKYWKNKDATQKALSGFLVDAAQSVM